MDHPTLRIGRDKRVPPRGGPNKQVPPFSLLCGRIAIHPNLIVPGGTDLRTNKTQSLLAE